VDYSLAVLALATVPFKRTKTGASAQTANFATPLLAVLFSGPLGIRMDAESNQTSDFDPLTEPINIEPTDGTDAEAEIALPVLSQLLPSESQYRCPGESHSISRAVHLSRLAAFFPACRECQHRTDTGELPPQTVERIQQVERRTVRRSVFHPDGIRGVFLNELTPAISGKIAAALARNIWDQTPLAGKARSSRSSGSPVQPARTGPTIVVGYDERPASPSILAAVIDALRMMSCQVVDVGLVSRPCFCFAVDHLQASGGVFVTGSNYSAAWTGLDLFSTGAIPLSVGAGLEKIEERFNAGVSRPTRRASYQRSFQAVVPYEAGLLKHFHALRPLKIVVAARPRPVRKTLRRLFKKLPCQLIEIETTEAAHTPLRPEVLSQRVQARIRKRDAHFGVLIHDDGCRTEFFDEQSRRVPQSSLCRLLARVVSAHTGRDSSDWFADTSATRTTAKDQPGTLSVVPESRADVVLDSTIAESILSAAVSTSSATLDSTAAFNRHTQICDSSNGAVAQAMKATNAIFGSSSNDRYWFREAHPACDAVLTLARVLEVLSLTDAKFSTALK
jgi:phosphomannomutase